MPLQIGIVGLPNVGKSTLFKALTKKQVPTENYPFCTIDPNVGVVAVPDERLDQLARVSQSEKVVPTTIEFVDIAGLVAGAHKGEGLGNKFLSHIREVDAIVEVVRVFGGGDVVHVAGRVDPASDVAVIDLELAMADLATVRKRIEATQGKAKSGDKDATRDLSTLEEWERHLNAGAPLRVIPDVAATSRSPRDGGLKTSATLARELQLLTAKPLLYVLNTDDREQLAVTHAEWRQRYQFLGTAPFVVLCAKIEAELAELPDADAATMRRDLGLLPESGPAPTSGLATGASGLDRLTRAAYDLLGLITYFTSGPTETRAWTVQRGTKAPQAAGVIHTDFEKGFIRAEVIDWREFVAHGEAKCKELGRVRIEGRDYEIRDGDTIYFRISA